jgi:hypothetical protein
VVLLELVMKNKFIFYDNTAIIEDYMYYTNNTEEIDEWLHIHGCVREGMVIKFCNDRIKTLFILKWS